RGDAPDQTVQGLYGPAPRRTATRPGNRAGGRQGGRDLVCPSGEKRQARTRAQGPGPPVYLPDRNSDIPGTLHDEDTTWPAKPSPLSTIAPARPTNCRSPTGPFARWTCARSRPVPMTSG